MPTSSVPRKLVDLNKAVARQTIQNTTTALKAVGDSVKAVVDTARVAGKTVVGQTRSAVARTATTAASGAKEVSGQVRAQGDRVAATSTREATRTLDTATRVVEQKPATGTPYEQWTRADLYARAQELHIDGRATMTKQQLIRALRH